VPRITPYDVLWILITVLIVAVIFGGLHGLGYWFESVDFHPKSLEDL